MKNRTRIDLICEKNSLILLSVLTLMYKLHNIVPAYILIIVHNFTVGDEVP